MSSDTASLPIDFPLQERELVQTTLFERYGRVVPVQSVEVELQIDAATPTPASCPALYWRDGEAHFVIARVLGKIGIPTYRTQFFYEGDDEVFGTGHTDYGNLGDCVVTVLQVQSAHQAERTARQKPASSKVQQPAITGEDEYHGPLVI